jgi:phage-related minor tail protein
MSDIANLLREAADWLNCDSHPHSEELAARLRAAAEADAATQREKVRVLREALENMVSTAAECAGWDSFPSAVFDLALDALATTEDV